MELLQALEIICTKQYTARGVFSARTQTKLLFCEKTIPSPRQTYSQLVYMDQNYKVASFGRYKNITWGTLSFDIFYKESTETGHTEKCTGYLKMLFLQFFLH